MGKYRWTAFIVGDKRTYQDNSYDAEYFFKHLNLFFTKKNILKEFLSRVFKAGDDSIVIISIFIIQVTVWEQRNYGYT